MASFVALVLAAATAIAMPTPPPMPVEPMDPSRSYRPVEPEFLMSRSWAPAGRCADRVTFCDDGTAVARNSVTRWRLEGSALIFRGDGGSEARVNVVRRGRNIIMRAGDQAQTIFGCPADS